MTDKRLSLSTSVSGAYHARVPIKVISVSRIYGETVIETREGERLTVRPGDTVEFEFEFTARRP